MRPTSPSPAAVCSWVFLLAGATGRPVIAQGGGAAVPCADEQDVAVLIWQEEGSSTESPEIAGASLQEALLPPAGGSVAAAIVSNLGGTGAQGWALAIASSGGVEIVEATTAGTVAEPEPEGKFRDGYRYTEIVDPDTPRPDGGGPQGPGVVSGVVLSFSTMVTLEPVGTATVLQVFLQPQEPVGDADGSLECRDGLKGSGQPIKNIYSIRGFTHQFCGCQPLAIRFGPTYAPFVRGDPNGDGETDLSDAIAIVLHLFVGTVVLPCTKAGDANDDGQIDISDTVFLLRSLFLAGPAPSDPSVECGVDPSEDSLACESFGRCAE